VSSRILAGNCWLDPMTPKASRVLKRQLAQMGEAGSAEAGFVPDALLRELDKSPPIPREQHPGLR
jgi:hypothetical protein